MSEQNFAENPMVQVYVSKSTGAVFSNTKKSQRPATVKPIDEDLTTDHVPWGDADDLPEVLDKMADESVDLSAALDMKTKLLYLGGLDYTVLDANGNKIEKRIPAIDRFIRRSMQYPRRAVNQLYRKFITIPQLILKGDQIHKIHATEVNHLRFAEKDKNGFLYKAYMRPDWHEGATATAKDTKEFLVIDPLCFDPEMLVDNWFEHYHAKNLSFLLPCAVYTGQAYYPTPKWYRTLTRSKWFDLAQQIPLFKTSLLKNQLFIKYHIQMPDYWMEWKYPGYDGKPKAERKKLYIAEIKKFEDFFKGEEKAGNSIASIFKTDHNGKSYEGWKITAIDDKIKDGMYIEDSEEAAQKTFTAVGVDMGILGLTGGDPSASRSGSQRRESLNLHVSVHKIDEDVVLMPFDYAAVFNKWTTDEQTVVFHFKKPYMQTLNDVSPAQRETTMED